MKARIAIALFGTTLTLAHAAELSVGAPTATPVPVAPITVQMTSATLADDCGGGGRPHVPTKMKSEAKSDSAYPSRGKAKRRCEQTSMQLSVVSTATAEPADLRVKKVEMLDESGAVVSELTAGTPSAWNGSGVYDTWDQRVNPSTSLSVSYALSQPDWNKITDRWNRTFTVRAVVTVSGRDQTLQRDVTVTTPTSLPPNVKT